MNAPLNGPQGSMHPEDKRNMLIFFLMCVLAFVAYDFFVSKPQQRAIAEQKAAAAKASITNANAPSVDDQSIKPRAEALAGTGRVAIKSETLSGTIATRGGRLDDMSLLKYSTSIDDATPVALMNPTHTEHPLYMDFGFLSDQPGMPDSTTPWQAAGDGTLTPEKPVVLRWNNGRGLTFERSYALDDKYMFTITQKVTNNSGTPVTVHPYASVTRQGLPADFVKSVVHQGPTGYFGDDLHEVKYDDFKKKPRLDFEANSGWGGFTDQYWFSGLVGTGDAKKTFRMVKADGSAMPIYQIDMTGAAVTVAPGASASDTVYAFVGPKQLQMLDDYAKSLKIDRFDLTIDFGMFWFLTIPFYWLLTWLGHSIGSFAVALLLFTLLVRIAVFPLANKSFRSFARMRKIQPRMLEVREKYGDDRVKLQQAIFELYKKEQVNPMAGCLPLLIQIPIFFALYKTLYITLEMRHAPFWGWISDMSAPDPLSVFTLFGLIDWNPPQILHIGIWPLIMGVTLWVQQRLNPPPQDPVQAKIMGFMPVIITGLMAHFPAGLVIYWSWSNFLSIIQQYFLMKKEGVEVHFFTRSAEDKKMAEIVDKGPNVHPAEEEIKEDLEAIEGKVLEKKISPPKPSKKR